MSVTPTLKQLYEGIVADLEAELHIKIPNYGKFFLRSLAAVQAAKLKLFYLALAKVEKNIFVDTAESEESGGTLERFGRVFIGRSRYPATQGLYEVQVTGTIGATIPPNTLFKSNDDSQNPGKIFTTNEAVSLAGNPQIIALRSLEGGINNRMREGDQLTSTSPLLNIHDVVTVSKETRIPTDREDIESYRQVILDSRRIEQQGGAVGDYRLWALDAPGVARAYPNLVSGEILKVQVFVEATLQNSLDGKGAPPESMLVAVKSVIEEDPNPLLSPEQRGRLPMGVTLDVSAVTINEIDIIIVGSINFTPDDQTLIQSALDNHLRAIRPFIAGADLIEDQNDVISINSVTSVIQNTIAGGNKIFSAVQITINEEVLTTAHTFINGNIPVLRNIQYQA